MRFTCFMRNLCPNVGTHSLRGLTQHIDVAHATYETGPSVEEEHQLDWAGAQVRL